MDGDSQRRLGREKDVHPRPESHDTQTVAALNPHSRSQATHHAPRQHPDHLTYDDGLAVVIDPYLTALVLSTRLRAIGREKTPRPVLDRLDSTTDRRTVDVYIQRRQEHAHLKPLAIRRGHGVGWTSVYDPPVRRRNDKPRPVRNDSIRISEEQAQRSSQRGKRESRERDAQKEEDNGGNERTHDERVARTVNPDQEFLAA